MAGQTGRAICAANFTGTVCTLESVAEEHCCRLVLYRVYCTNTYAASLAPNDERLGYAVITPFLTCQQSCGVGGKMSDSNFDLSKSSDSGSLA